MKILSLSSSSVISKTCQTCISFVEKQHQSGLPTNFIIYPPQVNQTALCPSFWVHYCLGPSPRAIRHEPSQKLQTGRGIKAHQLQSQNGKISSPLRSVIWNEQYPNAWESPSDETPTSTAPTKQRLEAHWKISEVTLSHYSNVTERWRHKPRETLRMTTNPISKTEDWAWADDHRTQGKVIVRNTCNCLNYQRIHGGVAFCAKWHGLAAKKIIRKCVYKNELCTETGKEATLQIWKCKELYLWLKQSNHPKNSVLQSEFVFCPSLHMNSIESLMFIMLSSSHTFYNGS